jgi:outer membrane protein assembly factor BamE (lipoprotein component of BamABCDE complex)
MKTKILILILTLSCFACKNVAETTDEGKTEMAFDKTKWKVKHDKDYPYRAKMLNNLMTTDTLKTLKKEGVLALLGEPSRTDTNYLFYTVSQERAGFWPLHTKTLVIKFSKDNLVEWVKIHE